MFAIEKRFEHFSVPQFNLSSVHISLTLVHIKNHNQTEYLIVQPMEVPTKFLGISVTVLVHLTEYRQRYFNRAQKFSVKDFCMNFINMYFIDISSYNIEVLLV
jgi:hypothetical protein